MARILVVGRNWHRTGLAAAAIIPLRTLGIETVQAVLSSSALSAQGLRLNPTSAECRAFLNTFDAILVLERLDMTATASETNPALSSTGWLSWNEPTDKPVIYFAPNLSTARTSLIMPDDFPIIRPDPTQYSTDPNTLNGTAYRFDEKNWFFSTAARIRCYSRIGGRFHLTRENQSVYVPAVNAYRYVNNSDNTTYFWALDDTKHFFLGAEGEILAYPDFEDREYPGNVVVAYRYKNRYFFPFIWEDTAAWDADTYTTPAVSLFWLLYALKCVGIQPARQAILCMEIDHPLADKHNRPIDNQTRDDQYRIILATLEYLVQFHQQTGLVVPCGIMSGRGRINDFHYYEVKVAQYPGAVAINDLLVRHHGDALPCGIHDHTWDWGAGSGTFIRAGENRHPYAAPNDVPVEYGTSTSDWVLVSRKIAPAGYQDPNLLTQDGQYYSIGRRMSGTGTAITGLTNLCEYTARMALEDEIDEMRELGFPDGFCGRHRYTNCAADQIGGEGYWKALLAVGFRGVRRSTGKLFANEGNDNPLYWQLTPTRGLGGRYRRLIFVPSRGIDWGAEYGCYGLYLPSDPTNPNTAAVQWDLNAGDLGDYATNPATRLKVLRRAIGLMVGLWLSYALQHRGTVYIHPDSWWGADVNNPLARVDTGSDLKVNPMVEICEAMRVVQQVLSDYLRFGSPTDVMDWHEQMMF